MALQLIKKTLEKIIMPFVEIEQTDDFQLKKKFFEQHLSFFHALDELYKV